MKELVDELKKLVDEGASYEEKGKVLNRILLLDNGAGLYIYDLSIEVTDEGMLDSVSFNGYYLYND